MYIDHEIDSPPVRYEADMKIPYVSKIFLYMAQIPNHIIIISQNHMLLPEGNYSDDTYDTFLSILGDYVVQEIDYLCKGLLESNTTVAFDDVEHRIQKKC